MKLISASLLFIILMFCILLLNCQEEESQETDSTLENRDTQTSDNPYNSTLENETIEVIESGGDPTQSYEEGENPELTEEELTQLQEQLEDESMEGNSFPDEIIPQNEMEAQILSNIDFDIESYMEILDVIATLGENNLEDTAEGSRLIDEYLQNNWSQVEYIHNQIGNLTMEQRDPLFALIRKTRVFERLIQVAPHYGADPNVNWIISYWIRYK